MINMKKLKQIPNFRNLLKTKLEKSCSQLPPSSRNRRYSSFVLQNLKMSYFSGTVLLGELDDFIAPAQACSTGVFSDASSTSGGKMQLVMEDDLGDNYG